MHLKIASTARAIRLDGDAVCSGATDNDTRVGDHSGVVSLWTCMNDEASDLHFVALSVSLSGCPPSVHAVHLSDPNNPQPKNAVITPALALDRAKRQQG